jgi:rhodanese-related sulfurtransferase
VPGALNVDLNGGQFATRASWIIPEDSPVILVLESSNELADVLELMSMVGQEGIVSYLLDGMQAWASSGRALESIEQMSTADLRIRIEAGDRSFQVLDVREDSEWHEGHIPGAIHIPFHQILSRLDEVPSNKPVATICTSGVRSSIAASILKAHGFEPVNITGGMDAWKTSTIPLSESQVK